MLSRHNQDPSRKTCCFVEGGMRPYSRPCAGCVPSRGRWYRRRCAAIQRFQPPGADRVAAGKKNFVALGLPQRAVERENDLGIRMRPVMQIPSGGGRFWAHLVAPLAQQVVGGEVMFDEFISPGGRSLYSFGNQEQRFGVGGIESRLACAFRSLPKRAAGKGRLANVLRGASSGRIQSPGRTRCSLI